MLGLGWGLAAALGAIAGMLTAPSIFLDPNMMQIVLIYAFAAAVLGGIDSPVGAVVGGLMLGVGLNLLGTLCRLHRRRAAASGGAARHPRRPARPAGRALRQAGGEEGLMRAAARLAPCSPSSSSRPSCSSLPAFVSDFRAQQFSYVGSTCRADRARHPHRLHGPDLARTWRLHGDRRVHDGDPDDRPRRQGHLDDPVGDRRRRRRRVPLRVPGRPPLRPLPRPRHFRNRGCDARPDQALRRVHGRRLGDQPVRHARADGVAHPREDPRLRARLQQLALLPRLDGRARRLRPRLADPPRPDGALASAPSATARPPPSRPASTSPARRRSHSVSAPPMPARPGRCSRSRRRTSTRTRTRSPSRSSSSSGSSSPVSAR